MEQLLMPFEAKKNKSNHIHHHTNSILVGIYLDQMQKMNSVRIQTEKVAVEILNSVVV